MTAVKPGDVESLLRRGPSKDILVTLVYGPDNGLVSDRVAHLLRTFSSDADDPFALVKLDGDLLATDPARLVDEAGTVGLFGGSRTIHIRSGHRPIASAVETLLESTLSSAKVVIEAGDLNRTTPLRGICERSSKALAIPCYADDERSLSQLITQVLSEQRLTIEPDARDWLSHHLGVDRRVSLSELEKLALYARDQKVVTSDDVESVVSDVSATTLNTLIDAAFAGRSNDVEQNYRRFRHEGLDAGVLLGGALRHASALLAAMLDNPGAAPSQILATWRGLHFKRQQFVRQHLSHWREDALRRTVSNLHETILACRRAHVELAHAQASAALLVIATSITKRTA